jgi:hypothetical protein
MGSDRKMDSKTDSKLFTKAKAEDHISPTFRTVSLPLHDNLNIS